jgi:4-amino-4-deoxy-L-arabinose transferase-like glycosyltransferase
MIAIRNKDYVWPLSEILKHPLDPLRPHLVDVVKIFTQYIGPTLLFIFPTIKLLKSKEYRLYILILLAWFILPTISNASIAKAFTSRYILFTLPAGIILISLGIGQFKYKYKYLLLALLLIPNIIYIYQISVRPFYAKLPSTELGYIEDWTSGWGISQSADYLIKRSKEANVIVGTEGNFGTLPDGLQIYTDGVEHLTVIGVGLEFHTLPANLVNARKYGDEVYLLMNKSRLLLSPEEVDKLTLVQTYEKPKNDKLLLYRFN